MIKFDFNKSSKEIDSINDRLKEKLLEKEMEVKKLKTEHEKEVKNNKKQSLYFKKLLN